MQNFHYMQKQNEDGEPVGDIIEVPLNEWQNFRQTGHHFTTLKAYQDQKAGREPAKSPDEGEHSPYPTMTNTKPEILEYAAANNIEVNDSDTKSDILWGIAQVLEIDPAELGVEE